MLDELYWRTANGKFLLMASGKTVEELKELRKMIVDLERSMDKQLLAIYTKINEEIKKE
jgi:hypothetical protein